MEPFSIPLGGLVEHVLRPGVWRVLGLDRLDGETAVVIEPWDDAAAGACHVAEAYSLVVPARLIRRLRPGRSNGEDNGQRMAASGSGVGLAELALV